LGSRSCSCSKSRLTRPPSTATCVRTRGGEEEGLVPKSHPTLCHQHTNKHPTLCNQHTNKPYYSTHTQQGGLHFIVNANGNPVR
jgi:hypothetical protein